MVGPDDASCQVEGGGEQGSLGGEPCGHEPQPGEEEGDDRGGEDFEEAFHPEVHYPPAPVFDHADVRLPAVHEARAIEQGDGPCRESEHQDESAPFTPFGESWPNDPEHQDEPEEESEEQTTLPDAPQVQVLPALMAPVEGRSIGQPAMDTQGLTGQRADDD